MTITATPPRLFPPDLPPARPGTLEIRSVSKAFPNVQALTDVSLDILPGRDSGLYGRERGREVDAAQDHQRRLPAGCRDTHDRWAAAVVSQPASPRTRPASASSTRSPRSSRVSTSPRTSGSASCRSGSACSTARRLNEQVRRSLAEYGFERHPADESAGRPAFVCPAAARRDHARPQVGRAGAGARRADLVADRRGGRPPFCARPAPARRGRGDHLRVAPHQGDPAALRPCRHPARWPAHRRQACRRAERCRDRAPDGRPRSLRRLPAAAGRQPAARCCGSTICTATGTAT